MGPTQEQLGASDYEQGASDSEWPSTLKSECTFLSQQHWSPAVAVMAIPTPQRKTETEAKKGIGVGPAPGQKGRGSCAPAKAKIGNGLGAEELLAQGRDPWRTHRKPALKTIHVILCAVPKQAA